MYFDCNDDAITEKKIMHNWHEVAYNILCVNACNMYALVVNIVQRYAAFFFIYLFVHF